MSAAETLPELSTPDDDPLIGRLVDRRYRVLEVLGQGGMGVVYAARHEVTGRDVALKVLRPNELHTDEMLARFAHEARTAAAIGHPNIVEVLDAGVLPGRTPFLVMELLEGELLASALHDGRLTPTRVAEIVWETADALEALHARGIIHRDVKTDNLFLVKNGRVKLLDFGLAVIAKGAAEDRLTSDGMLRGTPEYMPPESLDGRVPDVAWDVYALATVAYELLTGNVPFEHPSPLRTLALKRDLPPPPLSARSASEFSEEVERVIAEGLARDPAARPPSPMAFAQALASALTQPSTPPADASSEDERAAADLQEERALALPFAWWREALVLASCVVLAIVGLAWLRAPGPAVPVWTNASATPVARPREPTLATLLPLDSASSPARAERAPETAESAPVTTPTRRAARADPSAHPSAPRDSLQRSATTALVHGRFDDAIALFRRATEAAPHDAAAWRGLGLANERAGHRDAARRAYEQYLAIAPGAADVDQVRRRVDALRGTGTATRGR